MIITLTTDVMFVAEFNHRQFLVDVDVILNRVQIVGGSAKHTLVQQ